MRGAGPGDGADVGRVGVRVEWSGVVRGRVALDRRGVALRRRGEEGRVEELGGEVVVVGRGGSSRRRGGEVEGWLRSVGMG